MKKKLIATLVLGTLVTAGVLSTGQVKAEESQPLPIWQRIAEKFNLNQDEVQTAFEEGRGQKRGQRQIQREEKLGQAVSDGVISEDQKQALMAKQEEMKANRPEKGEFRNLSQEEREAQRETKRAEMQSWAEGQGIDLESLHDYMGGPEGRGENGRGMRPGRGR